MESQRIGIKKQRNNLVDMARLLCALLVVAAHLELFSDISPLLGNLIEKVAPNPTVPYFFAIAGYYFFGDAAKGKARPIAYGKRLLPAYCLWSALYMVMDWFNLGKPALDGAYWGNLAMNFFVRGSWGHLWFLPALVFAALLTGIVWNLAGRRGMDWVAALSLLLYAIGSAGDSYFHLAKEIPVLREIVRHPQFLLARRWLMMGIPMFSMGYVLRRFEPRLQKISARTLVVALCALGAIYLGEFAVITRRHWKANSRQMLSLYPLMLVLLLLVLRNPLPGWERAGSAMRDMANFTYYSHCLVGYILYILFAFLGKPLSPTAAFLWVAAVCLPLGYGLHRLRCPWIQRWLL